MKLFRIILILAVVVAIVALAGFLLTKKSGTDTTNNPVESLSPVSNQQSPSDASVKLGSQAPAREIVIEASEYKFSPSQISVKKGETVKITLKNVGRMQHDFFVEGLPGANIDLTSAGSTNSIMFTPSQKGTFTTFCSVGTHRQLGMVGKLIVE